MSLRLIDPLAGRGEFTDRFGWRAAIPGVVGPMMHDGQDIAAPAGTPIVAAHAGRVTRKWWDTFIATGAPAGGNMLKISSARISTMYAHATRYVVNVGDEVRAGQVIGYVGTSGASSGAHLHFIALINGIAVDPMPYLKKETPVTNEEIKKIARAVADELLSRPITRADDPKKKTTLKTMISHMPGRVVEMRRGFAEILKRPK